MKTYEEAAKELDELRSKWFDEKMPPDMLVALLSAAREFAKYDLSVSLNAYHRQMSEQDKAEES